MIITNEMKEAIAEIADTYGLNPQIDIAIEEMAELTKELLKYRRSKESADAAAVTKNIVEEMADVQIMLLQLDYLLRSMGWITDAEWHEAIARKLNRQLKRIAESDREEAVL